MEQADILQSARPGAVRLGGVLGGRLDAMADNSVWRQEQERLLRPYRDKDEVGNGDWRCEYWGKWASGAALAGGDWPAQKHIDLLRQAARDLIATQDADGYIGTRRQEHHLQGWDVWGRKYVLLGLLGIYDVTGDDFILAAARRQADSLISECGPAGENIAAIGYPHWKGLPPSSVLEPIALLYQRTREKKYLEFARHIVSQWSRANHWSPAGLRLVEDALAGKPPAQIGGAPKAYEMMSCYEGLCELYRADGNRRYLDAAVKLAQGIFEEELTIVGSGSNHEVWCGARGRQCGAEPVAIETCVTATWMKFCFQLLRLTGASRYADALETSLYNALLGALAPAGQWWGYLSGLAGDRVPSHAQHADAGTSCCVLSGPRGMLLTPRWGVMSGAGGPVVNLYNPLTAEVRLPDGVKVRLIQETDYPASGAIKLTVQPARPAEFSISLRIPGWSVRNALAVNGQTYEGAVRAGTYAVLRRKWRTGDTVALQLDLRGRLMDAPAGSPNDCFALMRGPLVLALDNRLCPAAADAAALLKPDAAADGSVALTFNPDAARRHGVWLAFDAMLREPGGGQRKITFCDFASAGNLWSEQSLYRVWLPQPLDLASVWQAGLPRWWQRFRATRPDMPESGSVACPLSASGASG